MTKRSDRTRLAAMAAGFFPSPWQTREISHVELGKAWPLTVDHGTLKCRPLGNGIGVALFVGPDGTEYALNGIAMDKQYKYTDITPIWADDPNIGGAKINITPLIDAALRLIGSST